MLDSIESEVILVRFLQFFISTYLRCPFPASGFHSWLACTDPRDIARIESKTVIVTQEQRDTIPIPRNGVSQLGRWMSEEDFEKAFSVRFPGCMKGNNIHQQNNKTSSFSALLIFLPFLSSLARILSFELRAAIALAFHHQSTFTQK